MTRLFALFVCLSSLGYAQDCNNNTHTGTSPFDSNLPFVLITTTTAVPAATAEKIIGTMKIFDARPGRTSLSGAADVYDGAIKIGRRGQSSDVIYCKKQYSVKTRWANDTKRDTPLLGLPAESDWVVQGPYADKTQQRNALMMSLSNSIGLYAPRFVFVELFLVENGATSVNYEQNYMGVYLLMEQISRGKDRVDVSKLKDDLSGGYIIKKDKPKAGNVNFFTTGNLVLSMVYPDEESVKPEELNWIASYISCFENALYSADFTDSLLGYSNYINVSNFIDYFLLSELSNNADSYKFSTYMHKDKGELLNMGPLWDYDLAFGNIADWLDASANCRPASMNPPQPCTSFWKYEVNAKAKIPDTSAWFARLLADPVFKALVKARWTDLRASKLSDTAIAGLIGTQTTLLNEAVARNFQKWRSPGLAGEIWPEPNTLDKACCYATYQEHVDFLRKYAQARAGWMDGALTHSMYTVTEAPPALACCSDPQFKSCTKPQGGTCSVSSGDVSNGLGQFYDPGCRPGIPGTDGCVGLNAEGACRWCLAPNYNPSSGVGSKSWIPCNLCLPQVACVPDSPTTAAAPSAAPSSLAPSRSPTTTQPTKEGDTRSPSSSPTTAPPTLKPTNKPTNKITPTSRPTTADSAIDTDNESSGATTGLYVGVAIGLAVLVLGGIGAAWYIKQRSAKKHNAQLHQGLLQ